MIKKISFICTTYNEENNILPLLESVKTQTLPPNEIVIVDSQSTDNTIARIRTFQSTSKIPLRMITKSCTRGQGRNIAIQAATGEIIVVSDAGCIAKPNWIKTIIQPIKAGKADVVAGFYHMNTDTRFKYCAAPFIGVMPQNINPKTFLPSSRSVAFTKKAWKRIDGYPDKNYAEDIVFAQNLFDHPQVKMKVVPKAMVIWNPPRTTSKFFIDIVNYTRGNIITGYTRHLKKNSLVAVRYAIGVPFFLAAIISFNPILLFCLFVFLLIYFAYPAYKFKSSVRNLLDVIIFGYLQIIADIAILVALFTPITYESHS